MYKSNVLEAGTQVMSALLRCREIRLFRPENFEGLENRRLTGLHLSRRELFALQDGRRSAMSVAHCVQV